MKNNSKLILHYLIIILGSAVYALATVLFIFPHGLILGGTSGISVILTGFLKQSPGIILTAINLLLLVAALIVLGKSMALRTLVGSLATTVFVALFEKLLAFMPVITYGLFSAMAGAGMIAIASGLMFYVDSSSGGTDIIALIIKKFSDIRIGRALLISDVLIVIVGGVFLGWRIAAYSFVGFLIKTLGIDLVIKVIKKKYEKHNS